MPGKVITRQQEKLYMSYRNSGYCQKSAAAKLSISERSGRSIETGQHSKKPNTRSWRTRRDPFAKIWETELVPKLTLNADLSPLTLLEYLQQKYPEQYPDKYLRTMQRRVKIWRALNGPGKEVMFLQDYPPGLQGLSDFTQLKGITITINGEPLKHLLYHFRLRYCGWSHIKVILGGESFTALSEGLQEALWRLGGVPHEHRTDSLSAAFKNIDAKEKQDITKNYEQLCTHYGMQASRNNRGKGHENGGVESPHGHIKRRIEQALILRGSHDFDKFSTYQQFMDKVVNQHNQRNAKALKVEFPCLQALPARKTTDYTETSAKVSSSSTICVRRSTYTVPSRLKGECLRMHLYHDRIIGYLGATKVLTLDRVYSTKKRARNVDYRHVIDSLVKKPNAFRYSALRNDLLPSPEYRTIWDVANAQLNPNEACRYIVSCLSLSSKYDCEYELAEYVLTALKTGVLPDLNQLQQRFETSTQIVPAVKIQQHTLSEYDELGGDVCPV